MSYLTNPMLQSEIETGTIGFVEVPIEANEFKLVKFPRSGLYLKQTDSKSLNGYDKKLPQGNWQLLGLSTELTEEHLKDVMPKYSDDKYFDYVNDYTHSYATAIESFNSLKQILGIVDVNRYGGKNSLLSYEGKVDDWLELSRNWQSEQSKVRKYVTLFEHKCNCRDNESWNCMKCLPKN